ncbi:hypothetical protein [Ferruginibacter sp.]|nr:hypothetical protein [Ferruginibacter sp.]
MRIFTCILMLLSTICFGQKKQVQKIASTVSIERLKKNLYYLASEQLEGRVMGSRGDSLASDYIVNCFKENNLAAPYKNGTSYFQTVNTYKKNLLQSEFIIEKKNLKIGMAGLL